MIPQKAIKKIKNDIHREIVVGHLLAYGFFPQTSEGIDQAKRFVAGLDQWIAPSDLPNYYDDIESDLMTGRETAGIRNIKMILENFYFGGGSADEPEEIPVELEVVEVEQKDPDEPVVVTVEAPFENPVRPGAPRRIRLPRVRNTIKVPQKKKKDTAQRMADAFDSRLDDLIDGIRNPDPGTPPRVRKKKKQVLVSKFKRVSAKFDNVDPYKAKTFTGFLGLKVKKAFGRAAEARRIAKEQGADEQGRGYFLKKALGFEFGGDKLARLKGTFSKSPAAVNDPALNADQRFLAGIDKDITPPPVKQGELFNTKQYETKTGLTKFLDDTVSKLETSFARVDKKFADLIQIKKSSPDDAKGLLGISKTIDDLKNILKKNNDIQSDINQTKEQQLELLFDIAESEQMAAAESKLEGGQDLSSTVGYEDPYQNQQRKGGGGFDLRNFKNFGKWFRRIKNPVRTLRAVGRLGRMKAGGLLRKIPGLNKIKMPQLPGLGGAKGAAPAAKGGGLLSKAGGLLSKIPGRGLLGAAAKSPLGKAAARFVPGANIAIGGALTASRLAQGDYLGAALSAGSMIPGPIGWAFLGGELLGEGLKGIAGKNQAEYKERNDPNNVLSGLGFSSGEPKSVMPSDGSTPQIVQRDVPWWEKMNPFKMSEGGVAKFAEGGTVKAMIGEAGPEMLMRNGENGGLNPYQSLAPMVIATREITKRAGAWADPVENYVKKITDPIAKQMKLSVVPLSSSLGQSEPPKIDDKDLGGKEEGGILGFLKNLFKGKGGKQAAKSSGTSPGSPPGAGSPGQWGPMLDLISSGEGGYDSVNPSLKKPEILSMNLNQLLAFQSQSIASDGGSAAVGRYQFINPKLAYNLAGISPTEPFSPANQDKMAIAYLTKKRRGDEWLSGKLSTREYIEDLAREWGAFKSYSGFVLPGNSGKIGPEKIEEALNKVKAGGNPAGSPAATAGVPYTPEGQHAPGTQPVKIPPAKAPVLNFPTSSQSTNSMRPVALQSLNPPPPSTSGNGLSLFVMPGQAPTPANSPSPIYTSQASQSAYPNSLEALRQLSLGRR